MSGPLPDETLVQYLCTAAAGSVADWTFDAWITVPLAASACLYAAGLARLWRLAGIGRGIRRWQAGCFAAGWLALGLALVSPIHRWGGGSFTIHMVEHELVMAVAAPLIVCARPGGAYAWAVTAALGARASGRLIAGLRLSGARAVWTALTRPSAATLLHGAAIWVWHAPPLFERTVTSVPLHRFQHVSFLVTGVLFWWALARRRNHGVAALHLFATMLHTSILGALIALAPHVLYRLQTGGAAEWGLTPLEDQQLAGLVMWIPAGAIYAGAALCCFAGWVRRCGAAAPASVLPPSGILVGDAAE